MGTKITLSIFVLFFNTTILAQARRQLQGKIVVLDAKVSGVLILNLNSQKEAESDKEGFFSISAQPEDVLVFSSQDLFYHRKIIEVEDFETGKFNVLLTSKQVILEEVEIVNYNAVQLGVLQKPAKSYTPAERRLRTAGDFKPIHLLALLGGGMPLDPVFNAINGKTKRLKKELKLERSQKRLLDFQLLFPKEDLITQVKVNADEVMEFTFFVLDKDEFINLLHLRDKNKLLFYLIDEHTLFKNQALINEKK